MKNPSTLMLRVNDRVEIKIETCPAQTRRNQRQLALPALLEELLEQFHALHGQQPSTTSTR